MQNTLLDLSELRFLTVDDSAEMRSLITNMLFSLGAHNFLDANDGGGALEIMSVNHIDVVHTDWMMTPIDGLELTRHIRTAPDSRYQTIPIIMISGYTEAHRVAQARNAGVTEFLAKPVSPISLYHRIEEVILRPRKFIRTDSYTGPDRHRHNDDAYFGPRRRGGDDVGQEAANESCAAAASAQNSGEA